MSIVISVLLIGVVTVIIYILVQKLIRSPVHEKNTDTEDISKKFTPSSKPLFKSDDDSSDQVSSIEKQLYDIQRFLKLDEDLYTFVESTVLDKLVLDNLISKCILTIEDREEIVKKITQNKRNKALLAILLERPYETFRLFKNVLKESDPHNSDVQDLLNKINWPKHIDKISCQNIIVFDHIVKLQKNYMAFVHEADCRTDIADRLYAADILNTEEKDEVCNISISQQESNRTLIKKLLHRSGNACKLLFEALKDAKYYELAIQMEKTPISPQEIRLCQIGKKKFKERQEERELLQADIVKMTTSKDESDTVKDDIEIQGHEGGMHEDPDLLPFAGTSENFRKLLSTGTYESFENRVFLCGSCACGKSTLASVLIGTPIPLTWKSTDGLVIHFGRNGINLESFEMVPLKEEDRGHNVLTKLVIGKPNREITKCQTIDNQHDLCFAPSFNDLTELNLQDSEIDANFSSEVSVSTEDDIGEYEVLSREKFSTSEMNNTSSISLPNVKTVEAYAVHDDILKEVESGQYKVKIAPSDLVDFGGQRSYDMTHQLFVQHGGTFVVMFDGSRDFQEPLTEYPTGDISNETIVKHWVDSILTYCVDDSSVMPKILFAATHRDILSDDMKKKKNREFVQRVTEMFGSHEMNKHIVFNPVFFINGTDKDDQEIQNLKNHIVTIARHQPSWGLRRPIIWVPIELMIDNMIKDNINIIPKTYLVEANTMNKDLALSDKQMSEFLLTQHALGKIMYFDQPELNNFIILYPPALVNILRSFITDEMFWPNDENLRSILRRMTETGKIHKTDLIKLWQQKEFVHHIPDDDYKEFIIQVLVHLDVLVLPKRYSGQDETHVDYFLVPCTVKHKMPMSFLDDKSFANRTIALVYHIQQSSIPSALSFKLIGAVSGIWPIKEVNERPLLYHSSAVICVDSQTEFRIMVEDNRIVVYLTNMSSRSCISPDIAASIQDCLTVTLQAVLKFNLISIGKNHQQVNVSNLFHIEVGEVCCRSPCVISISKAKQTHEWVCNNGNTHFSRDPLLWIFNKTHQECSSNCPGLDESVLTMSPSEQHLSRLAYQLNIQSCRELIINLGIQLNDWEDIEYSYTCMPLIIKIMALNFWKTKNIVGRPNKSFNNLLDALKAVGDTRHLLCKVFREYTHLLDIADVRLQEVPDDDVLQGLPKNLGNCAIPLGIELGISVSSIEETMTRHPRDMYNQISDILRKWKTSTCSREVKPTIYKLMLALERVHTGGLDYLKDIYLGQ